MSETTHILFIGNSFTARNDMPGMLTTIAASGRPSRRVVTRLVIANGMALKTHWKRGEAREAVGSRGWDFVVLQEQSTLPLKNRERMFESVRLFAGEIIGAGAKPVLYMTWARLNAWERQAQLADAYLSIGREVGARVAPVGTAWEKAFERSPGVVLHDKDGSHPNLAGSYLAACVFYATLLGASPAGLTTEPLGEKAGAGEGALLQAVAWEAVRGMK